MGVGKNYTALRPASRAIWLDSTLRKSIASWRLRDNHLRMRVDVEVEVHWSRLRISVIQGMSWTMMNDVVVIVMWQHMRYRELKRMKGMVRAAMYNGGFYGNLVILHVGVVISVLLSSFLASSSYLRELKTCKLSRRESNEQLYLFGYGGTSIP